MPHTHRPKFKQNILLTHFRFLYLLSLLRLLIFSLLLFPLNSPFTFSNMLVLLCFLLSSYFLSFLLLPSYPSSFTFSIMSSSYPHIFSPSHFLLFPLYSSFTFSNMRCPSLLLPPVVLRQCQCQECAKECMKQHGPGWRHRLKGGGVIGVRKGGRGE